MRVEHKQGPIRVLAIGVNSWRLPAGRAVIEQLQEREPVGCLQMIHLSSEAQVTLFPSSAQPRTEHRSILGSCHFCSKQEF